jgi:hypothetical protein
MEVSKKSNDRKGSPWSSEVECCFKVAFHLFEESILVFTKSKMYYPLAIHSEQVKFHMDKEIVTDVILLEE